MVHCGSTGSLAKQCSASVKLRVIIWNDTMGTNSYMKINICELWITTTAASRLQLLSLDRSCCYRGLVRSSPPGQRFMRAWFEKGRRSGDGKVKQQAGDKDALKGNADLVASWEGTFFPSYSTFIFFIRLCTFFFSFFSLRSNSFFIFMVCLGAQRNPFLSSDNPGLLRG